MFNHWTIASFLCWCCRQYLLGNGRCRECGRDYTAMLQGIERLHPSLGSREIENLKRERNDQ